MRQQSQLTESDYQNVFQNIVNRIENLIENTKNLVWNQAKQQTFELNPNIKNERDEIIKSLKEHPIIAKMRDKDGNTLAQIALTRRQEDPYYANDALRTAAVFELDLLNELAQCGVDLNAKSQSTPMLIKWLESLAYSSGQVGFCSRYQSETIIYNRGDGFVSTGNDKPQDHFASKYFRRLFNAGSSTPSENNILKKLSTHISNHTSPKTSFYNFVANAYADEKHGLLGSESIVKLAELQTKTTNEDIIVWIKTLFSKENERSCSTLKRVVKMVLKETQFNDIAKACFIDKKELHTLAKQKAPEDDSFYSLVAWTYAHKKQTLDYSHGRESLIKLAELKIINQEDNVSQWIRALFSDENTRRCSTLKDAVKEVLKKPEHDNIYQSCRDCIPGKDTGNRTIFRRSFFSSLPQNPAKTKETEDSTQNLLL